MLRQVERERNRDTMIRESWKNIINNILPLGIPWNARYLVPDATFIYVEPQKLTRDRNWLVSSFLHSSMQFSPEIPDKYIYIYIVFFRKEEKDK